MTVFCSTNGDAGVLRRLARFSLQRFFSCFIPIDYSRYVQRSVTEMNYFATGSITFTLASVSPALLKAKQGCCAWFVYRFFSKYSVVFVFVVVLFSVGVRALKFLQDPPSFQASHVRWTVDYNCTTDDPNATVSLLHSKDFGISYSLIPVTPNKLLLRKQVFTLVNLSLSDEGNYKCKATDQSGQTIEWNTGSMLFIRAGLYEYFE